MRCLTGKTCFKETAGVSTDTLLTNLKRRVLIRKEFLKET